jgi:hypothetical protein
MIMVVIMAMEIMTTMVEAVPLPIRRFPSL